MCAEYVKMDCDEHVVIYLSIIDCIFCTTYTKGRGLPLPFNLSKRIFDFVCTSFVPVDQAGPFFAEFGGAHAISAAESL